MTTETDERMTLWCQLFSPVRVLCLQSSFVVNKKNFRIKLISISSWNFIVSTNFPIFYVKNVSNKTWFVEWPFDLRCVSVWLYGESFPLITSIILEWEGTSFCLLNIGLYVNLKTLNFKYMQCYHNQVNYFTNFAGEFSSHISYLFFFIKNFWSVCQ